MAGSRNPDFILISALDGIDNNNFSALIEELYLHIWSFEIAFDNI